MKNYGKKIKVYFFILIILISFCGGFYLKKYFINTRKDISKYPLIDPARTLISQENFFTTIEPLRVSLNSIVEKYEDSGVRVGLYFEFLNTGANISINQDSRFWPASLSKMPTALVVMKKIENGDWKLSNELVMYQEDRSDDFGELYKNKVGTTFTIEKLLHELIVNSDDTAHRILIRNLTGQEFEEMLKALGMEEIYDKDYNITAKEYSRIFRSLYTSSYLSREYSTFLLELLSSTKFDEFLDTGIPEGIIFAHKIGEHDPESTYLDSGIVYLKNRPYLITVMVKTDRETAKKIMEEVSKTSYNYVSNY